jgi:hypothetical protein
MASEKLTLTGPSGREYVWDKDTPPTPKDIAVLIEADRIYSAEQEGDKEKTLKQAASITGGSMAPSGMVPIRPEMRVAPHHQPASTAVQMPPMLEHWRIRVVALVEVIGPGRVIERLGLRRSWVELTGRDEFMLAAQAAMRTGNLQHGRGSKTGWRRWPSQRVAGRC